MKLNGQSYHGDSGTVVRYDPLLQEEIIQVCTKELVHKWGELDNYPMPKNQLSFLPTFDY